MTQITLEQFQKELGEVDFFYEYLEDHSQWREASKQYHKVEEISKTNPEFKKLFDLRNPFNKPINNN